MPTKFILCASPDYVKQATPLGRTIDDDLLAPCIFSAQEMHILPVLGTKLYDRVLKDIEADSLTGSYTTLVRSYIQPCLTQFALAEVIPHLRVRLANNSATTLSSDQAAAVTHEDLKPLINSATNNANFHKERLIDYLCANGAQLFPEYQENVYPDLEPTRRNYTQGLNLDPVYTSQDFAILRQLLGLKK